MNSDNTMSVTVSESVPAQSEVGYLVLVGFACCLTPSFFKNLNKLIACCFCFSPSFF